MEFNSIEYIFFLVFVLLLFYLLNSKWQRIVLLAASYFFYSYWNVKYLFLIIGITLISYEAAKLMDKNPPNRRKLLIGGITILVLILFTFKYLNFFMDVLFNIARTDRTKIGIDCFNIILPVGISFYIFQAISYIVDVYKGTVLAEKSLLSYALYITFFPQLVAGPIERAENIIPQFRGKHNFDYEKITNGIIFIVWGLFKKMVIADELAVYVDAVYGNVTRYAGFTLVIATVMFALQIYCDFSGYSDIAIGSAKMFGVDLMKNFKAPYLADSVHEFWKRWHISLSQWLRDYIYIPLGGGRKGKMRTNINLLIVFLISGLWHGADLTYVIWGGVNGVAEVIERNIKVKWKGKIYKSICIIVTFCVCCFAWIFFRSNTLEDAGYVVLHITDNITQFKQYIFEGYRGIGLNIYKNIQLAISLIILFIVDILQNRGIDIADIKKLPAIVRWGLYLFFVVCILLFSHKGGVEFVYFQF